MKILYYQSVKNGPGNRLKEVIEKVVPKENVETCYGIESLVERLKNPVYYLTAAVLLATDREDMQDLLLVRERLFDVKLILVLPDSEKSTIADGHTMRPRLLSYVNSDFKEVSAVLSKIYNNLMTDD